MLLPCSPSSQGHRPAPGRTMKWVLLVAAIVAVLYYVRTRRDRDR
jgi:hypothetical protein